MTQPTPKSVSNGQADHAKRREGKADPPPAPAGPTAEQIQQAAMAIAHVKELVAAIDFPRIAESWSSAVRAKAEAHSKTHDSASRANARFAFWSSFVFIASLILSLIFLGVIVWMLRADKDLLLPVLSALISLIAGTGGGYVFGRAAQQAAK